MANNGAFSVNIALKEEKFDVGEDLFDLKSILNKVETGKVSEPEIPTKSSTEILSELFGAFNAEPPKIPERVCENGHFKDNKKVEDAASVRNKKPKKSKKKHKHKEKKRRKKTKSNKKQGAGEDSNEDTNSGRKKHKRASEKKKKKRTTDTGEKGTGECETKLMPTTEPVTVNITTDESNNVKRLVKCLPSVEKSVLANKAEATSPIKSAEPIECSVNTQKETELKEVVPTSTLQPKQTTGAETKPKVPGKIVIKNLKFSSVYEETVRQVEEQAKLKAERFEEGEISEDSTEEKEASSVDPPSPEPSSTQDKKEWHKHCRKHSGTSEHHHHRHHNHRSRSRSHDKNRDKRKRSHSGSDRASHRRHSPQHHESSKSHHSKKRSRSPGSSNHRHRRRRSQSRGSSTGHHGKKRSRSRGSTGSRHGNKRSRSRGSSSSRHSKRRSRSGSRKRSRRTRSRSRHRSRSPSAGHIDKQKLLEIARKNAMNLLKQGVLPSSVVTQDKVVAIKAGGKSVAELTDFCKQLSKKEALGQVSSESEGEEHPSSGSDTERPFHHPFQIKERPASIVMNIRNSVQLPVKTLQEKTAEQSKQLRIQFPVSSGQQHRKTENEWVPVSPKKEEPAAVAKKVVEPKPAVEPVNQVFPQILGVEGLDIGSIVSQRLTAMRKLQENPNDVQALSEMYRAQKDMQMWAESKQQPGQFTGSTGARVLSAAELASGYQAWAKKV